MGTFYNSRQNSISKSSTIEGVLDLVIVQFSNFQVRCLLESIWFLVWSNQPHHQPSDWTVAVGMAKPRKAREKERGGAFLRDLKRTSTTKARVNILVGIRAGRDWWAREERAAHIRWKIKGRGVLAHIKAREIWTCPVLTVGQRLQNTAPSKLQELKGKSAKEQMHSKHLSCCWQTRATRSWKLRFSENTGYRNIEREQKAGG